MVSTSDSRSSSTRDAAPRRRNTDKILDHFASLSEDPRADFMRLHDHRDPVWGDCSHPYPLRHAFAEHLDEVRANHLTVKEQLHRPALPRDFLTRALAALDSLPDPRIAHIVKAIVAGQSGRALGRELGISHVMVHKLKWQGFAQIHKWEQHGLPPDEDGRA